MASKHAGPPDRRIWITGFNAVSEALRSESTHIFELVIARNDARAEELKLKASGLGIPVLAENREVITRRVGHAHHQGVAALAAQFPTLSLEALLARPLSDREPLLLLDSIQDPQNLGALIRSGCFLGAKGILLPRDRSVQVTGTAVKVAAGGTSHVPIVQVTNLVRAMETIKESGLWIAGLEVKGSSTLYEADLTVPLALVVGNEQKGLRPLVRKTCDLLLHIPASGPLDSLNAATAGAVALAEVQRQRLHKARRP
jgi:23S rRNA (guanosine2251-2'-O)-methyltransferase